MRSRTLCAALAAAISLLISGLSAAQQSGTGDGGYNPYLRPAQTARPTMVLQGTASASPSAEAPTDEPAPPAKDLPSADPSRAHLARGTTFSYEYVPPHDPALQEAYDFTRAIKLFDRLDEIHALDGALMLPHPLKLTTAECQQVNAFYSPDTHEIVMCYEMVELLVKTAAQLAGASHMTSESQGRFIVANLRFMMLHEMGHALIDLLDIPSTGREEDAADQLAGTVMLLYRAPEETADQVAANLDMAAVFFQANGSRQLDRSAFADEHSLGDQRYYNLLCMVYGSDPAKYLRLVTSGGLPVERAERCPAESHKITHAWAQLLVPHFAPRYRFTDAEAERINERTTREQGQDVSRSPYVR